MNLDDYWVLFLVGTSVLALVVASPALSRLLVYPRTEYFSEMWLLGPDHRAEDYPFNVSRGQNYTVFLGVGDKLGYCAYYVVEVKFRNESMPAPSSFNRTSSSLSSLFNLTLVVADQTVWEEPLTFSFNYGLNESLLAVEFYSLTLNNVVLDLNGLSTGWNATRSRFYGNLVFELWLHDSASNLLVYHERYVDLKLNMTSH